MPYQAYGSKLCLFKQEVYLFLTVMASKMVYPSTPDMRFLASLLSGVLDALADSCCTIVVRRTPRKGMHGKLLMKQASSSAR